MNLIAIETSTENCSVALLHQGQITAHSLVAPRKHAELVLGYLQELLDEKGLRKKDINGIVFGQGPGAFTGVRIATSIVQGLALALEVPVMPVSTMHNMAHQIWQQHPDKEQSILIANDARMNEVYWATFLSKDGQLCRNCDDQIDPPEKVNTDGFDVCAGSAFQSMISANPNTIALPDNLPDAETLLHIAVEKFDSSSQNIIDIQPSYIREKVVFS